MRITPRLRRSTALLTVTVAATGAVLSPLAATAAAAAVSCYRICDGVEPQGMGWEDSNGVFHACNDARTIYTVAPPSSGSVELRYSATCRMAWARGGLYTIKVQGFNADGSLRTEYEYSNSDRLGHTLAVNDAGLKARACVAPAFSNSFTCGARF
jgi:hypothetical protein